MSSESSPAAHRKSPAFQWYPKDIETDEAVVLMDNRQFGAFVHLLNHGWLHCGIPADEGGQAKIAKESLSQWRKMWPAIKPCWRPHDTDEQRLVNPRQEREREKQGEFKAERSGSGKKGAEKRWRNNGSANGSAILEPMAKNSSSSSSATAITSLPSCDDLCREYFQAFPDRGRKHLGLVERWYAENVGHCIDPGKLHGEIMAGLDRAKASAEWEKADGKFICSAIKFLEAKRWIEDWPESDSGRVTPIWEPGDDD